MPLKTHIYIYTPNCSLPTLCPAGLACASPLKTYIYIYIYGLGGLRRFPPLRESHEGLQTTYIYIYTPNCFAQSSPKPQSLTEFLHVFTLFWPFEKKKSFHQNSRAILSNFLPDFRRQNFTRANANETFT